jgi:hypothetical protein
VAERIQALEQRRVEGQVGKFSGLGHAAMIAAWADTRRCR